MGNCIFCQIVNAQVAAHTVWESDEYMAFLSIYPNTEGVTVVMPKKHYSSYVFDLPEKILIGLVKASKEVGKLLDKAFPDVGRTAMVLEGFGVDHAHAKLFPLHGTNAVKWKQRKSNVDKYFEHYENYVSSHDYKRADDAKLEKLAKHIRSFNV